MDQNERNLGFQAGKVNASRFILHLQYSKPRFHLLVATIMSSTDILGNVVEQRDSVNTLYRASLPQESVDTSFILWSDKSKLILSHEVVYKDRSLIVNVDIIHDKASSFLEGTDHDSTKKKNPLLSFGTLGPEISFTNKPCPSIKDIRTRLSNESLVMLVYDYAGYSFSSEFNLIYKGMFESLTAVEDTLAVIRKALTATDPALNTEQCTLFALFILVRAAWDSQLLLELFQQYFKATFPNIKKFTMQGHDSGLNTRIFIGRQQQSGVISFTVRCECLVSLRDDTFKANETPEPQPLIMYHDYKFDAATIASAEEMSRIQQQLENERDLDRIEAKKLKFDAARDTQDIRFFLRMNLANETSIDADANDAATAPAPLLYDQLELDSLAPRTSQCSASFCAETFGWGYDSFFSLGLGTVPKLRSAEGDKGKGKELPSVLDEVHDPRPIPLLRNIALEQVRMISCSARHTLLLTHYGGVYACGDNSEGALGTGDTHPRNAFTPIDMSSILSKVKGKIAMVAAGGSVAGSHSMAIDSEGSLYGWGYARAVGVGTVAPLLLPTAVEIRAQDELAVDISSSQQQPSVRSVACGAGFTVLVMQSGSVYTTGAWAHGRLGLGDIPQVTSSRGTGKVAKYQLRFIRVIGIETSVAVACGESHVLCLLASGHVLAWGQNALGQIGTGPLRSGMLRDQLSPVIVPPFGSKITTDSPLSRLLLKHGNESFTRRMEHLPHEGDDSLIKGSVISCGSFHSLVMDRRGNIWSWGARGSPCLGHADGKVQGQWSHKVGSIFSVTISEGEVMVPYELLRWCSLWSMPRRIAAFDAPTYTNTDDDDDMELNDYEEVMKEKAIHVVSMSAGDLHSAFLADNGRLYLCGAGPVVPPIYPADALLDEEDDNGSDVQSKHSKATAIAAGEGQVVASPRCPSAQWMSSLAMRAVKYIASGGCRFIAICDEETVSINLSLPLHHRLRSAQAAAAAASHHRHGSNNEQSDVESGDEGSSSLLGASSMWSDYSHVLESRGRADCMVICSGHTFLCHRALLAKRSTELRDIILQETPSYVDPDYPSSPEILTQVLLPELHRDAARALSYYLYRDTLPRSVVTQLPLLYSLVQCGKNLKMYRLQMLCERFIALLTHPHDMNQSTLQKSQPVYDPNDGATNDNDTAADDDAGSMKSKATASTRRFILDELPPLTLTRDFGNLLGDPEFADVRFSAEGRTVAAHRFILEARCEYFKAMFRSGMQEMLGQGGGSDSSTRGQIIDVVVPDTFVGFLRLLIFIYTDTLPDGTDGALLEDLMAADRYGMMDMKSLCEQMLVPTKRNWLDLLRAADLLYAPTLQRNVLAFLRDNFDALHLENAGAFGEDQGESLVSELQEEFPSLLEKLLLSRRVFFPLPPSQALINQTMVSKEVKNKATQSPLPLLSLLLMLVFALIYQQISSMISLGWVIPAINGSLALGVVAYFGWNAYSDLYRAGNTKG